jgi:hypothetical protein
VNWQADQKTLVENQILGQIAKKVNHELQNALDLQKKHRDYFNQKKFQLESGKISFSLKNRQIRDMRLQFPILQEKIRQYRLYVNEESKVIFLAEKKRNMALMNQAAQLKEILSRKNINSKHILEDLIEEKISITEYHAEIKRKHELNRVEFNKADDDVNFLKAEYQILVESVERSRNLKLICVQKNVMLVSGNQARDMELLLQAVEKRKAMGFKVQTIQDLDSLELQNNNLFRVLI